MADRQISGLRARLTLDTSDVGRGLADATRQVRGFTAYGVAGLTGVRVAAAGIGVGLGAAVKSIVGAGIAFQDSLNTFQAVTSATGAQMKAVSKAAIDLGNDLSLPNTSASDAATAMTELAKAGLTVDQALAAAKGTLQLATAGNLDVASAAADAANALNEFGLNGDQAVHVADLLAGAANASSGEVGDYGQALSQVGLVAQSASQSIEQTVGALALFAQRGLQGADAGVSLKTALLRLEAPMTQGTKEMTKYGLSVRDAHGTMLPLTVIAQQLHDKLGTLNDKARDRALYKIFGTDAIRVGAILTTMGSGPLQAMIDQVDKAGTAAQIAAAKSRGLGGAVRGLTNELQTLSLEGFQAVAPGLEAFTRGFTNDIPGALHAAGQALGALRDALAPLGPTVLDLVDAGEHLVHALAPIGKALAGVVGVTTLAALHAGALALEGIAIAIDDIAKHEALIISVGAALATAFAASKLAAAATGVRALMAALETKAVLGASSALGGVGKVLEGLANPATIAAVGIGAVAYGFLSAHDAAAKTRAEVKKLADQLLSTFDTTSVNNAQAYATMVGKVQQGIAASLPETDKLTDANGRLNATGTQVAAMFEHFGGSANGAAKALMAAYDAQNALDGKNRQVASNLLALATRYGLAGDAALDLASRNSIDLTQSADKVTTAFGKLRTDTSSTTGAQRSLATATSEVAAGFDDAGQSAQSFGDVLNQLIGIPLDAAKAQLALKEAVSQATAGLAQNGRTLDVNTKAGQANRNALYGIADAGLSAAKALQTQDGNSKRAAATIAQARQAFVNFAVANGQTTQAARELADSLGLIPAKVAALVPAMASAASGTSEAGSHLGANFSAGLVAGILANKGKVSAAAYEVAQAAQDAAKINLRIKSPSREMYDVGVNFGVGFILGIQNIEQAAASAAGELAQAALTAARRRAAGGSILSAQTSLTSAGAAQVAAQQAAQIAAQKLAAASADQRNAQTNYSGLASTYNKVKTAADAATTAAEKHAAALKQAATQARRHAQDLAASTTATQAQKDAANAAAQAAERQAQDAATSAAAIKKQNEAQIKAAKAQLDAAKTALDQANQNLSTATSTNDQAQAQLASATQAIADAQAALADAVYTAQEKQAEGFVGHVKDALDKVLASVTSFRTSFEQGITQGADLGSIFREQGQEAVSSVNDVIAELQARVDAAKKFADDLEKLRQAGADAAVISQIAGQGSNFGEQEAQAILAGGASAIASLNSLTGQLSVVATSGVDQLAAQEFGPAADALVASLGGLTDQFPELAGSIGDLTAAVEQAFGSASAGPDVAAIAASVAKQLGTQAPDLSINVDLSGSTIDQTTLDQLEAMLTQQQAELNTLLQQGVAP